MRNKIVQHRSPDTETIARDRSIQENAFSFPVRMFRFVLQRCGLVGTILIVTIISSILSMIITALITLLIYGEASGFDISPIVGAVVGFLMALVGLPVVNDLEKMRQQLEHIARTDSLTQAFNRGYFIDMLSYEMEKSKRDGGPLTLILFDIDNFKAVNDRYGHNGGDAVLRAVSQLCRRETRPPDIFARVGGEEFACLLSGSSAQHFAILAERLRQQVESLRVEYETAQIHVTISVGMATMGPDMHVPEDLLRNADIALYHAKGHGKNRIANHDLLELSLPSMQL